jgi:RNA polymerase sigma-70 factor (ECF subfamily)
MPVTPPVTPSDAELVRQALDGSQLAYRHLVNRYARPAVNLAARMVQDRALAEDIAQEAFARAFEHLSTYDEQRRFASWFFQILHNVTIDYLRRKRPPTLSLDDLEDAGHAIPDFTSMGTSPDRQAEQSALARAFDASLVRIRPEYREAVVLRYREDLSVEEIAEAMSLPVGTVKTYLFRARKELASLLSAQGWAGVAAASGARKTGPG